jgi:hypothetical protein
LVNDKLENNTVGKPNKISLLELILLCSRGKSSANIRKAAGIIPDVAKPILPQNNLRALSFKK